MTTPETSGSAGLAPFFWRGRALSDLSREEWEALCDGCGRCCLLKLEDEDTGRVHYTDVHCRLFDPATCRCGNYPLRRQLVKGCVSLTPEGLERGDRDWLPRTCAYRRLAEGKDLPAWHWLVSGSRETVREAGIAVEPGAVVPEWEVPEEEWEDHVIEGIV